MQYVFSTAKARRYRFPTHVNELIIDRADASTSEVFVVVLEPGEAAPLHRHDDMEQIFHLLEGQGTLLIGTEQTPLAVKAGDVVRIPPSTWHTIKAGRTRVRYLAVDCFTAARKPEEPTWDAHVKAICEKEGWDYDEVTN